MPRGWDPWLGPMPETAAWYRIELVRGRPHRLHEKVAPLLVRLLLPDAGLRWLTSNPAVVEPWVAILTGNGEAAGKLGEIVH
jgi:hypothetical protein